MFQQHTVITEMNSLIEVSGYRQNYRAKEKARAARKEVQDQIEEFLVDEARGNIPKSMREMFT
jgi:hypothetical protein